MNCILACVFEEMSKNIQQNKFNSSVGVFCIIAVVLISISISFLLCHFGRAHRRFFILVGVCSIPVMCPSMSSCPVVCLSQFTTNISTLACALYEISMALWRVSSCCRSLSAICDVPIDDYQSLVSPLALLMNPSACPMCPTTRWSFVKLIIYWNINECYGSRPANVVIRICEFSALTQVK